MLSAYYPEVAVRVTNSGISGNTSKDLLLRFKRDVLDLKPDYISICIGINDVWRQFDSPAILDDAVMPQEYESNLRAMIMSSIGVAKAVFILSPYYMEPISSDLMRARMDVYGNIAKKLADEFRCEFIDLQKMFDEYFKFRHSSFIAWDRVHPNQVGATLIAREFLSHCGFDPLHIPKTSD
ncbi:MAG: SGNH/GDSL hydrolase family protein [Oscillospiraceae bacterium]